ncbi:hypothetical protein KIN20_003114 [Parelaphostrongylus tenuis]|uniref:Uncharacterized protein n=1 Tax=Parelaphostrongylus tenuis TaxID=148309 RepID=A0AAD5MF72_PARTN|nr:hypothetical protein KIN20_003114 [Parelaphostrongylus tenuis]
MFDPRTGRQRCGSYAKYSDSVLHTCHGSVSSASPLNRRYGRSCDLYSVHDDEKQDKYDNPIAQKGLRPVRTLYSSGAPLRQL